MADPTSSKTTASAPGGNRVLIVEALMALAAERAFDDITMTDIAQKAGVSLADFRDAFPSKGAVLGAFSRQIDRAVLGGSGGGDMLAGEPAKERLFDVLMRRLDALAPYKPAIEGITEWARREPLSAVALNRELVNSLRFMLEAAGIDSEGSLGTVKLQGFAFAWSRIVEVWLHDDDPGLAKTMAALDRELSRGETLVTRIEDLHRLTSPLRSLARAVVSARRDFGGRQRERATRDDDAQETDAI